MLPVASSRPWQFSLRSLLAVTALVAAGAALFGWRERQLEPQRRAVARIVELGGSVEMERRGWIEAAFQGRDTKEVVSITLPGHLSDDALATFGQFASLKQVTLAYSEVPGSLWISGGVSFAHHHFLINGEQVNPSDERVRYDNLREALPRVAVVVSHDGVTVPLDRAFANITSHLVPGN